MKVSAQRVPESQVVLEIEVEKDRVDRSLDQAYRRLANRARIPGFRPGKAPRPLIERTLGTDLLMQEALDKLVPEVYREAVEESAIDPIDMPDLEVTSMDPVTIKATVAVRPTVDLGSYREIRVNREPVSVPDDAVESEIELWQRRFATWEPVERGLAKGDLVRADVEMVVDEKPVVQQEDAEFILRDDIADAMPGLVEGLEGMGKGESKSFTATIPEDFRDRIYAGVEATYRVEVKEIKEQKLPELDEEFVKGVGDGFESVEAFRTWVREGLQKQAEEAEQSRLQQAALEELVNTATIEYPQVLVEHEVSHMLREQLGGANDERAMERYLGQIGRTEADVRAELNPVAADRVRRSLVLSELAKAEEIAVGDEDIDAEIDRVAGASEQLKQALNTPQFREQLGRTLITRKTLGRLSEIVAPDGAAPGEDAVAQTPAEASGVEDEAGGPPTGGEAAAASPVETVSDQEGEAESTEETGNATT